MVLLFAKSKLLTNVNMSKRKYEMKYDKDCVYNLTVKNAPPLENHPDT